MSLNASAVKARVAFFARCYGSSCACLVDFATTVAHTLVGKVLRLRCLAGDEFLLARIGAVTVHTPLGAVQQSRQRMLVMHVRSAHSALCASPVWLSTPMCRFIPKDHCWPFLV